jgi:hypothetical protein
MRTKRRLFLALGLLLLPLVAGSALFVRAGRREATQISGTISTTLTIHDDSELVGDVTCLVVGAPCIAFGASNIKLRLNGFTITGRASPPNNCVNPTTLPPEDGIDTGGQTHVAILGPGLVQKFGRMGITLSSGSSRRTRVRVDNLITADNCFSGIFLATADDNDITQTVSVRNGVGSQGRRCGGT